jgi:hypothetical protein
MSWRRDVSRIDVPVALILFVDILALILALNRTDTLTKLLLQWWQKKNERGHSRLIADRICSNRIVQPTNINSETYGTILSIPGVYHCCGIK